MSGMSRYIEQYLFDQTLNPSTRVAATYLALHVGDVDDELYGNEASYTGYARQSIDSLQFAIEDVGGGVMKFVVRNGAEVNFPVSEGPTVTISHWAIWDHPDAMNGNVLYSGSLTNGRIIESGDGCRVGVGALRIVFT